jgi:hypothetical protein
LMCKLTLPEALWASQIISSWWIVYLLT